MSRDRVLAIRKALGFTQERLAHLLGVTWTTISRWEAGVSSPTGMPARLLYLLEVAATDRRFVGLLRDPRARDPMFTLYQMLHGVYRDYDAVGAGRKRRR